MNIEVIGRHALYFDDDDAAAFVNSNDALVDWNSLKIDRYDVRHLLSSPLPPRSRRNYQTSQLPDFAFESELDHERYLDLPSPSVEPGDEEALKPEDTGRFHAVAFSYGNTDESANQKNAEGELECSGFRPLFAVPENLFQCLPPTEKVHQIIAKTATFVSKHGGQSEIVLRVKQGDNPTFGFLMPDHHLHPYFRFLVDHQELLQSDIDGKTQPEDQMAATNQNSALGGALSLLGSVYGSGEDEDSAIEGGHDVINAALEKTVDTTSSTRDSKVPKAEISSKKAEKDKDDVVVKHPPTSQKEKTPALKKNPSIAASKTGIMSGMKQKDDSGLISSSVEKLNVPLVVEPPSDMKKLIDKIVDFITKNGKQFEIALREQDSKHGRFPFLLPSNQYHPYYLKVLQGAEESKVGAGSSSQGRDNLAGRNLDKKAPLSKDNGASSLGYVDSDVPFESDRKEKFKMVIGKSKNMQEEPSNATQQEFGISVDAEAAAAILQAATRGIRYPNLGIISSIAAKSSSHCQSNEVGQVSNLRSQGSSQPNDVIQISHQDEAAKGAVAPTSTEVDSSGAYLTKEQKLKAERLKKAKMFVAQLKSGTGPSIGEPSRTLSEEPVESRSLGIGTELNLVDQAKEGSSALVDCCTPDEIENVNYFGDEYNERRSKRKYRLRSERNDVDNENDDNDGEDDEEDIEDKNTRKKHGSYREKDEEERVHKHSKRKHRSRHSSDEEENSYEDRNEKSHKRSRKKHRSRYSPHEDDDRRHSRCKRSSHRSSDEEDDGRDYEDEKYHKHSRKKHRSHRDSRKHKKESHRRSKHRSSSDSEHEGRTRHVENSQREDLEEGEISSKVSDQSRGGVANGGSRETSMDIVSTRSRTPSQPPAQTTEISDDLRAKVRAMLMATR